MKYRLLALLVLTCMTSTLAAQDATMVATVKGHVQKMMDATCNGDYRTMIDLTYPKVIDKMGGKEAALKLIEGAMSAIKGQGIAFKVKEVGNPAVMKSGKDYYSVTPYTFIISAPDKKTTLSTAFVGISSDDGKSWKFVNLDDKGEKGIREMLPQFPAEMKVPNPEAKVEKSGK